MSKIYWILMIFCFSTSRIKFESLLEILTSLLAHQWCHAVITAFNLPLKRFPCLHTSSTARISHLSHSRFLPHSAISFHIFHHLPPALTVHIALECSLRFCARSSLSSSRSLDLVTVPHSSQKLLLLPSCSSLCIYDEGYICSRKIFSHIKVGNKFTLSLKILLWSFRTLVFSSLTASRWKSNNCV